MSTRTRIAGVLVVVALVAAAGTGLAASDGVQSVAQPDAPAVDTRQAQVQEQTQTQMQTQYCTYPSNGTYESFDVSNLSAPSGVEAGEPVTVSANITNPNDVPMIQCVEFRLEGDVVERTGWALNPNETETIEFDVNTTGLEDGTYIHGIETRDFGELTTLTVGEQPEPEEPTATLQFDDQESDGSNVTVASANLSEGGYIAILDENGSVVGATDYLESGEQENVSVPLLEPLNESANLTAQAHLDTNDNQTLDFLTSNGTEDGPYTMNGTPVTDDAVVTVGEEPTTETPTEEPTTDEPTTDEPTTEEPTTDEPTTDEPTTDEPTTDEPTTDEPTTDEPTTDEPTTDEPTTDEPMSETPPPTETPIDNETEN